MKKIAIVLSFLVLISLSAVSVAAMSPGYYHNSIINPKTGLPVKEITQSPLTQAQFVTTRNRCTQNVNLVAKECTNGCARLKKALGSSACFRKCNHARIQGLNDCNKAPTSRAKQRMTAPVTQPLV